MPACERSFWRSGRPRVALTPSREVGGLRTPPLCVVFKTTRGRPDPENDRLSAKSVTILAHMACPLEHPQSPTGLGGASASSKAAPTGLGGPAASMATRPLMPVSAAGQRLLRPTQLTVQLAATSKPNSDNNDWFVLEDLVGDGIDDDPETLAIFSRQFGLDDDSNDASTLLAPSQPASSTGPPRPKRVCIRGDGDLPRGDGDLPEQGISSGILNAAREATPRKPAAGADQKDNEVLETQVLETKVLELEARVRVLETKVIELEARVKHLEDTRSSYCVRSR